MILNKSSVERGFGHGTLIKTEQVDLRDDKGSKMEFAVQPLAPEASPAPPGDDPVGAFGQKLPQNRPGVGGGEGVSHGRVAPMGRHRDSGLLDADGLPHPGAIVWPKQVMYSTQDATTKRFRAPALKGEEVGHIDQVRARARLGGHVWVGGLGGQRGLFGAICRPGSPQSPAQQTNRHQTLNNTQPPQPPPPPP